MTDVGIKPFLCEMIDKASIRGEWEKWLRSLELYLAAEEISEKEISEKKKKRDKLLHLGGAQLQEVAFNLPGAIESKDPTQDKDIFKILVDKLTEYFSPKRNSVFERHVFRSLKPHEGEMFNKFILRIRHQATKCTFGKDTQEATDINMIDKIIDHWAPQDLRKKLLEKERTLDEVIEICQIQEQIGSQAMVISASSELNLPGEMVNKISFRNKKVNEECTRCGRRGHTSESRECPAKNAKCNKCNLQGHFALRCKTKMKRKIETTKVKSGRKQAKTEINCIDQFDSDSERQTKEESENNDLIVSKLTIINRNFTGNQRTPR